MRPAKHDFSEVVKAVVQLMAKDGRFEGLLIFGFWFRCGHFIRSSPFFWFVHMMLKRWAVRLSELQQHAAANALVRCSFDRAHS